MNDPQPPQPPKREYSFSEQHEWMMAARQLLDVSFYPSLAYNGRWVVVTGETRAANHFQRGKHVDVAVQLTTSDHINCLAQSRLGNGMLAIDEKLDRKVRNTIFCETISVKHAGKPGWMVDGESKADVILWAYVSATRQRHGLIVYMFQLEPLVKWFWPRLDQFREYEIPNKETRNGQAYRWLTVGRSVPIRHIPKSIILMENHFVPAQLDMFKTLDEANAA